MYGGSIIVLGASEADGSLTRIRVGREYSYVSDIPMFGGCGGMINEFFSMSERSMLLDS